MQSREEYRQQFEKVLHRLNPEQRQVVEDFDGPALVLAGPGTGKTQVLTARIGRILLETDTQAHNILCLTFTEAAVIAMRERLLQFIGPEAHRIHIYTFHSFCNQIIQRRPEHFGKQGMEPLTDLERVEIIREILDQLPYDHILKKNLHYPYFYEAYLQDIFKKMKAENWTSRLIEKRIEEYLESLPNRKEFRYQVNRSPRKKGDLKEAAFQREKERMQLLLAGAKLFSSYKNALRKAGRYDYEDMILWVLEAFKKDPRLLRFYQEQYLYLLADEYQDTNGAQNELLLQLAAYWDNPNIFVVGDDDQSIYEFQGARVKNMVDFYKRYQSFMEPVVLTKNYRSTKSILDSSSQLIINNKIRLIHQIEGLSKDLIAINANTNTPEKEIEVIALPDYEQEIAHLLLDIKASLKQGTAAAEIAVIYARHSHAELLTQLLAKEHIPFSTKRPQNALHQPLILHIRTLMEYIQKEVQQAESGAHLLYALLHLPYFDVRSSDLMKMSLFMQEMKGVLSWRTFLSSKEKLIQAGLEKPESVLAFNGFLEEMLQAAVTLPLPMYVERLVHRSGIMDYCLKDKEKIWLSELLNSLLSFIAREQLRKPTMNVDALMKVLDNMEANHIPIIVQQESAAQNGIQLITAHSAKGLEFDQVYIINCVAKEWENVRAGGRKRFAIPDTLTYSGETDKEEARRRLMYVAMTRARKRLCLSYSHTLNGKAVERSMFIDELLAGSGRDIQERSIDAHAMQNYIQTKISQIELPEYERMEKGLIDLILSDFQLSVSAFNRYLQCPLSFYYEQIVKVPGAMSQPAAYGTALHNSLFRLFEKMRLNQHQIFPPERDFLQYFENEMQKQRANFDSTTYQHYFEKGRAVLSQYYKEEIPNAQKEVRLEMMIKNVEVEGVPITGIIDKVEIHSDQKVSIVDYKTGKPRLEKVKAPSYKKPEGGSYWRQLMFYKLLYESDKRNLYPVHNGVLQWLEPDPKDGFSSDVIYFSSDEVHNFKQLLKSTYQSILSHDFYSGCGESYCQWCNFVKERFTKVKLVNPELEGLDDSAE